MNYSFLKNFFTAYGLSAVIIAVICSACTMLLSKLLKNKLAVQIKTQLPFLLAIIIQFAYDMIFVIHAFELSESAFAAGILSGSLSVIFNSFILRIKDGEFIGLSATALLIEGIIDGIVPESCIAATAMAVESIIAKQSEEIEKEQLVNEIVSVLKVNMEGEFNEVELRKTARLIVEAVDSL